ncbi:MAG: ABC-2 type transporter, partial [Dehalococcoidia bacterium]|nr:ABC-2 type transporter [Dehalococcoidia bacterium]
FAGERERHTLETLLASRLPDRAILFGKLGVPVLDAIGATLVVHLVSLTALNVVHWDGTLMLYTPTIALINLGVSFLLAMLAACLGVIFSLRAATAKQAAQNLMIALLSPLVLFFVGITLLGTVLPAAWRAAFERFFAEVVVTADLTQVLLVVIVVLTAIDVMLLWAALARFQRARLILA